MTYCPGNCYICKGVCKGSYPGVCSDCQKNLRDLIKHIPKTNIDKEYHKENFARISKQKQKIESGSNSI